MCNTKKKQDTKRKMYVCVCVCVRACVCVCDRNKIWSVYLFGKVPLVILLLASYL